MFVFTAKLSKTKIAAAIAILIAVVVLVIVLVSGGSKPKEEPNANSNDARVTFLAGFGWNVNAEPVETQQVKIPDAADNEVFTRYNELQQSQGYDLREYAGKNVIRYVYEILNYPDASEPVYATIFVYEGNVIGGDVTNSAPDGKIHGFAMPS